MSLVSGVLPFSTSSTIVAAVSPSLRVSLKIVEYCTPSRISLSEGFSASWPVTIGLAMPAALVAFRMPREMPS